MPWNIDGIRLLVSQLLTLSPGMRLAWNRSCPHQRHTVAETTLRASGDHIRFHYRLQSRHAPIVAMCMFSHHRSREADNDWVLYADLPHRWSPVLRYLRTVDSLLFGHDSLEQDGYSHWAYLYTCYIGCYRKSLLDETQSHPPDGVVPSLYESFIHLIGICKGNDIPVYINNPIKYWSPARKRWTFERFPHCCPLKVVDVVKS